MTEKALDKLLKMTLVKEFPVIEKMVVKKEERDINNKQPYKIFLGVSFPNLEDLNPDEVRDKAKKYCSYLLNPKEERISQVVFFDPHF